MRLKHVAFTFFIICFINILHASIDRISRENTNSTFAQSCLQFADENDFIKTCYELIDSSLVNRKKIEKLKNFNSMLDAFDELSLIDNKEEYEKYVKKNQHFILFNRVKTDYHPGFFMINPRINLLFSSLVNTDGEVKIGNQTYNLLEDRLINKKLETLLKSGRIPFENCDSCDIVTIPEYLTFFIPMCKLVVIPVIYPTKYFRTTIDGENVIIQVWKGYYPGILGYPDGVGAEVGLYRPLKWTKSIWMPDYKNPRNITFKLISKSTNELVLSASKNTWWLNSWERNYSHLSVKGKDYILKYSVADSVWVW